MMISFEKQAFGELTEWAQTDKKVHKRIINLIKDIMRQPYTGLGKPEPLKHQLNGYWSRRITEEHRLVYKIENDAVIIIACKHHYH
jgi:toxin YoeB